MTKRIFLSSPTMHSEEQQYVLEAINSNKVTSFGKNVTEFENEISDYVGCSATAAMTTGTHALHMAIKLAGIKTGDIVLCSDLTFVATANPISYEGAKQVFIDSEYDTWCMNPIALKKAFKKYGDRVKAVIVVNLYGVPAKLDEIKKICNENNAVLIEDSAESLSAFYKGKHTGTFGQFGVISFNGNKIITTSGGGMLLSDDVSAMKKARFYCTQARDAAPWYQHSEIGYNYRMSNIVAGIGRGQLLHLNEHKELKTKIYNRYKKGFSDIPVKMNPFLECSEPNFWISCLTINSKSLPYVTQKKIRLTLESYNIESRPIWKPMHLQPVFSTNDFITVDNYPVSEDIFKRGICLPSDIKMTDEQQDQIIKIIKELF